MTPEELDRYLTVARKHGALLFKLGDVQVNLGGQPIEAPQATFVPDTHFVAGGLPDKPSLPVPTVSDPVKRWDEVDAALWPEGAPA